jgi:2-haloacid dehalogenase
MPDITDFKVLMFDCYGTLIDWERGILNELQPWAARHGLDIGEDVLLEKFGETEAECEAAMPSRLYPQILEEVLRRLATRWSAKSDAQEARSFGESVGRWPAFADSPEALRYLQKYYKLVILSNVDHASFAESQQRLGVLFDCVITAQDVGSYKPDLRNFEHALKRVKDMFGAEPGAILHVAQSLFHDIVPANSIGLCTMWVNRRKEKKGWGATPAPRTDSDANLRPDFEVASLAEFAALHRSHLATTTA